MISAIIFTAIVVSVSLALSKTIQLALLTHKQRCAFYQANFLAQSGFIYAKKHWENIPLSSFNVDKDSLYSHIEIGLLVPGLEDTLSLIKTSTTVYSIVVCQSQSRAIYFAQFTKTGDTVMLGPIQKL